MVQYNQTNLPWAIQPSNIIIKTRQIQYHVVFHMSGIVYSHYAGQKSWRLDSSLVAWLTQSPGVPGSKIRRRRKMFIRQMTLKKYKLNNMSG